jgi:hypothetical protein
MNNQTRRSMRDLSAIATTNDTRRGFLRGLVHLPLIGGGITLIGAPSAVAEPVTKDLLYSYKSWLQMEHPRLNDWESQPQPSTRAAGVLSAVGCDWRMGGEA